MPQVPVKEVLDLLAKHNEVVYPGERISILELSLRTAFLAEEAKAPSSEITAALLHNLGHLLHLENEGGAKPGRLTATDDITGDYLRRWFGDSVIEPIRLQVAAKRYLSAAEPGYADQLTGSSNQSLATQGGPMSPAEADEFQKSQYAEVAVRIRRLHDRAKVDGSSAPDLDHFVPHLDASTVVIDRLSASQFI